MQKTNIHMSWLDGNSACEKDLCNISSSLFIEDVTCPKCLQWIKNVKAYTNPLTGWIMIPASSIEYID